MQTRFPLTLRQRSTSEPVKATLTLDITDAHLRQHAVQWLPYLGYFRGADGDGDWQWRILIEKEKAIPNTKTYLFTIETDKRLQGMMIAQSGERHRANLGGQKLLYISYLAAAPWNRGNFRRSAYRRPPPALAGVGEALIVAAIAKSRSIKMSGRVGLHSLAPSLDFYTRNCHFTFVGKYARALEAGEVWCELPAVSATFLEKRRAPRDRGTA